MTSADVSERLGRAGSRLRELGVESLALFGSAARGEDGPDSDLDFLVQFEGAATFNAYMSVKELLEEELNRRVDLVTYRALKPELKERILSEAQRVA